MPGNTFRMRVWGEYALFSRPEFKVERVSYPVMTPSAARGICESVFWRPEIRYEIRRIGVVKPGTPLSILRNEMRARQGQEPVVIEAGRQQRTSLILRDVEYVIEAAVLLRPHATDPLPKYLDQVRRRIDRGQCYRRPCLGVREFAADFEPAEDLEPPPIAMPVGTMLFDIAFVADARSPDLTFRRPGRSLPVEGYHHPLYMRNAAVENGWLQVPSDLYRELYGLEGGHA